MSTHVHHFGCPETDHGTYHGSHANTSPAGVEESARLQRLVDRFPNHPIAKYIGKHVTPAEWLGRMEERRA